MPDEATRSKDCCTSDSASSIRKLGGWQTVGRWQDRHAQSDRKSSIGLAKDTWPTLAKPIEAAGLSPPQVQACWLKHVEANPKPLGEFPDHALALQQDMTAILNIAKHHYPNLRVVYLSSRTFGGWSGRASGSPEPYAYESGFGTRWVVQSQIKGDAVLNFDPARGDVRAPLVMRGPFSGHKKIRCASTTD